MSPHALSSEQRVSSDTHGDAPKQATRPMLGVNGMSEKLVDLQNQLSEIRNYMSKPRSDRIQKKDDEESSTHLIPKSDLS